MIVVKPPFFIQWLLPKELHWSIPTKEKIIYLTFDDGPTLEYTSEILKMLEKHQAKATFFCVGENIVKHPKEFNAILAHGHSVGNHTYNHLNGFKCDNEIYLDNIKKCDQLSKVHLFRPPYGHISPQQVKRVSKTHHIVLWSVMSYDFKKEMSPQTCLKNTLRYSKPGSIVVFHDHAKAFENLSYALPRFLDHFSEKGFSFKSLKKANFEN